jgi:hypothetical protein
MARADIAIYGADELDILFSIEGLRFYKQLTDELHILLEEGTWLTPDDRRKVRNKPIRSPHQSVKTLSLVDR